MDATLDTFPHSDMRHTKTHSRSTARFSSYQVKHRHVQVMPYKYYV